MKWQGVKRLGQPTIPKNRIWPGSTRCLNAMWAHGTSWYGHDPRSGVIVAAVAVYGSSHSRFTRDGDVTPPSGPVQTPWHRQRERELISLTRVLTSFVLRRYLATDCRRGLSHSAGGQSRGPFLNSRHGHSAPLSTPASREKTIESFRIAAGHRGP